MTGQWRSDASPASRKTITNVNDTIVFDWHSVGEDAVNFIIRMSRRRWRMKTEMPTYMRRVAFILCRSVNGLRGSALKQTMRHRGALNMISERVAYCRWTVKSLWNLDYPKVAVKRGIILSKPQNVMLQFNVVYATQTFLKNVLPAVKEFKTHVTRSISSRIWQ